MRRQCLSAGNLVVAVNWSEHRPLFNPAERQPSLQRLDRAARGLCARDEYGVSLLLLGLCAPDVDFHPMVEGSDVFFFDAHEFRPAERSCEAHEDKGHIPRCPERLLFLRRQYQLDDVVFDKGIDASLGGSLGSPNALHGALD